jgi:hypothetical protein
MVLLRKETLVAKLKLGLGQVHLMPVHSLQGSPVDQGSSVIPALGHLPSHPISIILELSLQASVKSYLAYWTPNLEFNLGMTLAESLRTLQLTVRKSHQFPGRQMEYHRSICLATWQSCEPKLYTMAYKHKILRRLFIYVQRPQGYAVVLSGKLCS